MRFLRVSAGIIFYLIFVFQFLKPNAIIKFLDDLYAILRIYEYRVLYMHDEYHLEFKLTHTFLK